MRNAKLQCFHVSGRILKETSGFRKYLPETSRIASRSLVCILNYVISWLVSAIGSKHRYIRCGFEFHMSHIFQHRLQHRFQLIFSSRLAYGLHYFPSSLQMLSDKYNIIYLLICYWFNLLLAWTGLLKCFGNFTKTLHGILKCSVFMVMSKFLMLVPSEIFMFFN